MSRFMPLVHREKRQRKPDQSLAELVAVLSGIWPALHQLPGDVRWIYRNEIENAREALAKYGVQQ